MIFKIIIVLITCGQIVSIQLSTWHNQTLIGKSKNKEEKHFLLVEYISHNSNENLSEK